MLAKEGTEVVHSVGGGIQFSGESTEGWARMEGLRYVPVRQEGQLKEGLLHIWEGGGDPCVMVHKSRSGENHAGQRWTKDAGL